MKYKAILFDMDGTLLPMDTDKFVHAYFSNLTKVMLPFGFTKEELRSKLFAGVEAMVKNDGHISNMDAFWEVLSNGHPSLDLDAVIQAADRFYETDFHKVKDFCSGENPFAPSAVSLAKEKFPLVILATNPLFPISAQRSRLSWIGLTPEDFTHVTSYEFSHFCKPNPKYYLEILQLYNLRPEECLMIGNDELEDMHTASSLGIDCYLVTDWMIPRDQYTWNGKKGSFQDLLTYLKSF